MKINYGLRRYVGKKIELKNGQITVDDFDFENSNELKHAKLRQKILKANPGWSIEGYCKVAE